MKAIQARVTGQVQGVAFRWHAQEQAQRLGVAGWVRNEVDGSVLVHAEGEDDAVDALVEWCRHGPPSARVRELAARDAAVSGASSFEVTG
ncbi:acylphosphatase [Nocardioides sp. GCM10028917]|jgi:acylphosphatase|uniref:acylphosphatase n=1 Tax=Nocardioides sp. GCM10028917 TaxID=3273408 RepID=UPI003612D0E7